MLAVVRLLRLPPQPRSLQPLLNIPSSANLNGRLDLWVGTYNGSYCPATVELETWYN